MIFKLLLHCFTNVSQTAAFRYLANSPEKVISHPRQAVFIGRASRRCFNFPPFCFTNVPASHPILFIFNTLASIKLPVRHLQSAGHRMKEKIWKQYD